MTGNLADAPAASTSNPIALANDAFRTSFHPLTNDWVVTAGLHALGPNFIAKAVKAVMEFSAFTPDNDPYGKHDFGSLTIKGHKLFWKIDCYDRNDMTMGSPDPADPTVTRRIMTIMLASDY